MVEIAKYRNVIIVTVIAIIIGVIIALSQIPLIVATYSGSHSVESSTGEPFLNCILCHRYIEDEFNYSSQTRLIFEKHKAAADNINYTTFIRYGYKYNSSEGRIYTSRNNYTWDLGGSADPTTFIYWDNLKWIDNRTGGNENATVYLDVNGIAGIQVGEICLLCHRADMYEAEAHGVTVVGCSDIKCHGNADGEGYADVFYKAGKAGYHLSRENVHSRWFKESRNSSEFFDYTVHNGTKVSDDFLTCMGCHSNVYANINVTKEDTYSHDNASAPKRRYL